MGKTFRTMENRATKTFTITDRFTGKHVITVEAEAPLRALDKLAQANGLKDHQEAHAIDPEKSRRLRLVAADGKVYLP
jgi:ribosomal protein S15P/S13E